MYEDDVDFEIDLLAVPDFASGAMENWGLVSFREDRIMFDEKIASILQKQQLGETMAHEIAHFCKLNYHEGRKSFLFFSFHQGLAIMSHVNGGMISG